MNTLSRLDDPLGTPPIEPAAIRHRARQLQRRRSGRRFVGVAGGAAVLTVAASLARPDAVIVDTTNDLPASQPAPCLPSHRVTRTIVVLWGSTPADNEQIVASLDEMVQSKEFAAELRSRLDADPTRRPSVEAISNAVSLTRHPSSAMVDVVVQAPDADDADQLSRTVLPSLTEVLESAQRNLPIEERIPGPIFEEVSPEPTSTELPC